MINDESQDDYVRENLANLNNIKEVDWINKPSLPELKNDLALAEADYSVHIAKIDMWLDNLNVTGSAKVNNGKSKSSIVPKLIRKHAEWRYSALSEAFLSTEDLFDIEPVTFEDKQAAIQNGLVLNNQFNTKINKQRFFDEYVRTGVDEGTIIVRVGWNYQEAEEEVEVPTYTIYQGQQIQVGTHIEKQTKVIKNHPTVDVCNYRNVLIDPTCLGDMSKAKFVIYKFETCLSDLQKDGRYINLDQIQIDENSPLTIANYHIDQVTFNFKDLPRKKFVAHEYWGYWDINNTGIVESVIITWVGNVIIRMEKSPFPDGELPFVTVQYLPVRRQIYGEPDGVILEDNQRIIGAVTRGMLDILGRSAVGQAGTRKDALDPVNKRKFQQGLDYEYNPGVSPNDAFFMHTYPDIPQSAQYMLNLQSMEAESLTGVKAFSGGISGEGLGKTAIGVRSAMDAASKRELGILRRLAKGIVDIGRKIVSMNAEFLSEEEVVRITNEEFVTINRDDLAGNFDLRLTVSTPEADEQKAQELSFMLQTMGNTMPQDFSQMILADIARLRKMPTLAKKIETYQPQPDPMAQQMQQLQMQLLQAQIANEQAKAMENQGNAMLDQAKAITEQAKAKMLDSTADKVNLDFVEQESGIAHKRHVDSIQSQARGNIALEQAKHSMAIDKALMDHQQNLQNKAIDHISAIEQLKAKPTGVKK